MKRRDFIKLSAVAGGSLLASNWLLETEIANAASSEIASKDGILQLTLVADEKLIKYGNTTRWAMTYNGIFPAPTLRANPGDTLKITLVNKLNQATNLHTHGLHVSPTKNSDNPLVMVAPGETFNYKIKIPLTQKSGTFWYHPHHHELSAGQVASGLAGVLVVEDALDQKAIIKDSTERLIVLADPRIGKTSAVAATSAMDLMHGRSGPNTLANGILVPSFTAIGSTPERWRIVNSCVSQYQTISIPGAEIFQVSADSSRLSRLTRTNQVTLTPGQRTELLISAPKAGIYKVQNEQQEVARIEFNSVKDSILGIRSWVNRKSTLRRRRRQVESRLVQRLSYAQNIYTDIEVLRVLAEDKSAQVRQFVAANPTITSDIIGQLVADKNQIVEVQHRSKI